MRFALLVVCLASARLIVPSTMVHVVEAATTENAGPYPVAEEWSYFLSANRSTPWPECRVRFLSFNGPILPEVDEDYYSSSASTPAVVASSARTLPYCSVVNMWDGAGGNQQFQFLKHTPRQRQVTGLFALVATTCKNATTGEPTRLLAYDPNECGNRSSATDVSLRTEAEILAGNLSTSLYFDRQTRNGAPAAYIVSAFDRGLGCPRILAFPTSSDGCDDVFKPGQVFWQLQGLSSSSPPPVWHATPARAPKKLEVNVTPAVSDFCADPYLWHDKRRNQRGRLPGASSGTDEGHEKFFISCTGGLIRLYHKTLPSLADFNASVKFDAFHQAALGGAPSPWCSENQRWAPETIQVGQDSEIEVMLVCDHVPNKTQGPHRIGYVVSPTGHAGEGAFTHYSTERLQLSPGDAGDIDPHFFEDPKTNKTYLVWKWDENRIGKLHTHIWGQEITIDQTTGNITQLGDPQILMGSRGEWWIVGYTGVNSSLVEGPEVIYHAGYYYLFFAAGRTSDASYSEGVARSKNFWGPYEKQPVPLLTTGMMPLWQGERIAGPGHAGFWWQDDNGNGFKSYSTNRGRRYFAAYHGRREKEHGGFSLRTVFLCEIVFGSEEKDGGWPRAILPHW